MMLSLDSFSQNVFNNSTWANTTIVPANTGIIGGIAIGTQGSSGIYSGYTLAGGDDFASGLNVVNVNNQNGIYFPTIAYQNGTRGTTGLLADSYDSDPYNTGHQDSNRGVSLGSNTMSQSSSLLSLTARLENSTETGNIGSGRTLVDAMLHTGGYLTVSPPCIIEAYVKFSNGTLPSGWHPTFWILNAVSLNESDSNSLEFDWEANTYSGSAPTAFQNNYNVHGTVSGWSSGQGNTINLFDGNWHLIAFVLTSSSVKYYADGSLITTVSGNTLTPSSPYYILFSNHIINPSTIADWNSATESYQVDYYRVWIANSQYPSEVIAPTENLPNIQVNYNTSMTYNIPSATTLWGAGVTDYCQAIPFEDYEPGCSTAFNCGYSQWPSGLSFNSSTRVLTGVTSDTQPGRLHVACMPAYTSGGGVGYVARGYIDVGPTVTITTLSATHGQAYSYDLYPVTPAGTLVPKTITCTGLPSGLSFSASTGLITGTPASSGTSNLTIGVTNSSGQSASQNVTLTVS